MLLGGTELPVLWVLLLLASLAEAALRFVSWSRLEDELEDRDSRERYARYLEHVRTFHAISLVVRVAATVALVGLVAYASREDAGRLVASVVAAAALVAGGELGGRFLGRRWSAGVLRVVLPVLYGISFPFRLIGGARGAPSEEEEAPEPEVVEAAKEEIRVALEDGTAEGALDAEEKQMIEGILKFRQVDVAQIMTPRTEIEGLEADMALEEALESIESFRHSRIPVYEDVLDEVVGIVYVKDLLSAARHGTDGKTVRDVAREPYFSPETRTVDSLLRDFQDRHIQIAIVLDEYGGVSGVVSVEDIMEEIVGEIEDEYDEEDHENRVRVRASGGIEADARVRIDELNEAHELDIPEDEAYDTVGGYVASCFGRVPEPGEEYRQDGLIIRVLQSDPRRLHRVFLKRL